MRYRSFDASGALKNGADIDSAPQIGVYTAR
jgi:hypothetical protein